VANPEEDTSSPTTSIFAREKYHVTSLLNLYLLITWAYVRQIVITRSDFLTQNSFKKRLVAQRGSSQRSPDSLAGFYREGTRWDKRREERRGIIPHPTNSWIRHCLTTHSTVTRHAEHSTFPGNLHTVVNDSNGRNTRLLSCLRPPRKAQSNCLVSVCTFVISHDCCAPVQHDT